MGYLPRLIDTYLDKLLEELPAIAIDGAKGVGKTATAARRADQILRLDTEEGVSLFQASKIEANGGGTLLIDEWQYLPESWNLVRRAVDDGARPGSFLLTGSATPVDSRGTHSGAGRIVSVRLRPLGFSERQVTTPSVSFSKLLESAGKAPIEGETKFSLGDYAAEIERGGFPGIRDFSEFGRANQMETYLERIIDRDLPEAGFLSRDRETLLKWIRAYAAGTATTTSYSNLLANVYASQSAQPAKTTVLNYQKHLERIWVVDPIPGWSPSFNPLKHTGQAPKHHLLDPALAMTAMGLGASALTSEKWIGFMAQLFESLVALTVRGMAAVNRCATKHMRLHGGTHEIDLIVERRDGAILPIEVKLARNIDDHDVRHLNWLRNTWGGEILDAAVIYSGQHAYRRPDGIAVIPLALLGA